MTADEKRRETITHTRRDFLRDIGLLGAGLAVGDRLELLERLTWRRRLFPSAAFVRSISGLWIQSGTPGRIDFAADYVERDAAGELVPGISLGSTTTTAVKQLVALPPNRGPIGLLSAANSGASDSEVTIGNEDRLIVKVRLRPLERLQYSRYTGAWTIYDAHGAVRA
jgi:hypothetical protein